MSQDALFEVWRKILSSMLEGYGYPGIKISPYVVDESATRKQLVWDIETLDRITPQQTEGFLNLFETLFVYKLQHLYSKDLSLGGVKYSYGLDIAQQRKSKENAFWESIGKEATMALMYNQDRNLEPMNPRKRHQVHTYLEERFPAVESTSFGEEPKRYIRLRNKNRIK